MAESEKARKVRKQPQPRKKASKIPLYVLIIVVVVVFTLIGIGIFYSIGQISANVVIALLMIIAITVILEFMLKRPAYRREIPERDDEGDNSKKENNDDKTTQPNMEKGEP
jgi:flagellar basal body-associated protein FliL